jgi:hypothetical protein
MQQRQPGCMLLRLCRSGTATTGRGGCLTSQNGVYKLCIQPDANLVLLNLNNVAIWWVYVFYAHPTSGG